MEQNILSHYVTRSLTAPWEQENRKLKFYDFDTNIFLNHSSRTLLTVRNLLNGTQENYFSKHAEQPLGLFKRDFLNVPMIEDRKIFRSPYIYIILQIERLRLAKKIESNEKDLPFGKNVFELSETELDQCVWAMQTKYKLVTLDTLPDDYLFYPETGYFSFPMFDFSESVEIYTGMAIPISINKALCLVPINTPHSLLRSSRKNLSLFSVGLSEGYCNKILLPPLKTMISEERFKEIITGMRKSAIEVQKGVIEMQNIINEIKAHF